MASGPNDEETLNETQPAGFPTPDQPAPLEPGQTSSSSTPSLFDGSMSYAEARKAAISKFERLYLIALLDRTNGNVSQAAREAGINRVYLYRLMRRHKTRG